jgi:orotidine-5'-phosphate decarboxylase
MNYHQLINVIKEKRNFLCVGLDPDIKKIPQHLFDYENPILQFCKEIIQSTSDLVVAYKPNLAFFEALGPKGLYTLEQVQKFIPSKCFTIADAKRGDIGNTAAMYARSYFQYFNFDAITVAPYMGRDSIEPFLDFEDKMVILLGLTSNSGSEDFEKLMLSNGNYLYEEVISKSSSWAKPDKLMYVVGATQSEKINRIRQLVPDYFFLVPGVGAQGGSISEVINNGSNADGGLLINSSRDIIYASSEPNFAEISKTKCVDIIQQMNVYYKF